jgi:hypothetical protein
VGKANGSRECAPDDKLRVPTMTRAMVGTAQERLCPPYCSCALNSSPRHRGFQEEATMLELFILAAGFAGGYAASVVSWPWIRERAIGASAEINQLRARAKALEDSLKGAL